MKNYTKNGGIWDDDRKWLRFISVQEGTGLETWVKSGEEWWRVSGTLHPGKRPVYRGLRGMGEEWRVFHESIVYSILRIRNPRGWSCSPISYGRFYYAVWTANCQIWRQLTVLGKTANCSGSASKLFYGNSKLARLRHRKVKAFRCLCFLEKHLFSLMNDAFAFYNKVIMLTLR